jgi:DNA-binding beta-propeller fold protein YncE/mono/diheme cytochrome c family protein
MRRVEASFLVSGLALAVACASCGGSPPLVARNVAFAPPSPPPRQPSCARAHADPVALPLMDVRTSSTVAVVHLGDRTLAYVADEDTSSLRTVDLDAKRELSTTPLGARPSHVLVLPDGRVVVGLRDAGKVAVLEPSTLPEGPIEERCSLGVAPEPVALALSPDDATLFVSSGWGRALGAYDVRGEPTKAYEIALPREPRAVLVSDDGKTAYVTHAVGGRLSRVDLTSHELKRVVLHERTSDEEAEERDSKPARPKAHTLSTGRSPASCQGFALAKTEGPGGRLLAPQVLVDPGRAETVPSGYGNDNQSTEEPDVAVVDVATGEPFEASLTRTAPFFGWGRRGAEFERAEAGQCLLPRATAYDARTRSLLVTCLGADAVVAYDALAARPAGAEKRRWSVPGGPTGVAVDAAKRRAVVFSQFERKVSLIDLASPELSEKTPPVESISLAADPAHSLAPDIALGRQLFHATGDGRISLDGRACASCHPDGRDDALVWATPDGPRRSIMLAGRLLGTSPYSWEGGEASLEEHLAITFERLHGAGGLRSLELSALAAYVGALPQPPPLPVAAGDVERVQRGDVLFHSSQVGCADCHGGKTATDNGLHDIQSKTGLDRSGLFNTPSLRFIGGTGPYFHDGRYATLHDLLVKSSGTMGDTAKLTPDDLLALEAYVRTR